MTDRPGSGNLFRDENNNWWRRPLDNHFVENVSIERTRWLPPINTTDTTLEKVAFDPSFARAMLAASSEPKAIVTDEMVQRGLAWYREHFEDDLAGDVWMRGLLEAAYG